MEKIRNRQDIPQEDKWAIEDLYPTDQAWEQELNTLDEDIPQEDKWAIEDLYPTDQAWEQELNTLDEDSTYLASFAGRLGQSGEVLCQYLTAVENMNVKADKLGNYCMRRADEDTRNGDCQAMTGRYISKVVAIGAACSFDTPEIMAS